MHTMRFSGGTSVSGAAPCGEYTTTEPSSVMLNHCAYSTADDGTDDEAAEALRDYFDREPTLRERRHFWSYVVFAGWCWYVWSLEKEAEGDNVGEWLLIYYRYAQDNVDRVLSWYEEGEPSSEREAS